MIRLQSRRKTIDAQLDLLEDQVTSWEVDAQTAHACPDADAIVNLALGIYRSLRHADHLWVQAVQTDGAALGGEGAQCLQRWYSSWLKPCERLLAQIRQQELDGYGVESAGEFRDACLNVRSVLSLPGDAVLATDGGGPGRSTGEIRDALRRRLEQAGR